MICQYCGLDVSFFPPEANWRPHLDGTCISTGSHVDWIGLGTSDQPTERDGFIMGVIVGVLLTGFAWWVYAWTMAPGVCR